MKFKVSLQSYFGHDRVPFTTKFSKENQNDKKLRLSGHKYSYMDSESTESIMGECCCTVDD